MAELNQLSNSYLFVNKESGVKCVKMSDELYSIGGNLVKFKKTAEDNNDFSEDFFLSDSDYGPRKDSPVFYQHLQDNFLKQIPLSNEFGTLKMTDDGVWIDAQLDISRKYAEMVAKKYGVSVDKYLEAVNSIVKMAEAGILGWSSGVAGHQMEAVKTKHGNWLKMWYLGSDASLTPNPAEFKTINVFNKAMTYKNFVDLQKQNPTIKMMVSNDITEQPEETKAGRMFSGANLTQLTQMKETLEGMISQANTGNNALTDNAPANETGSFDMQGETKSQHSMNPNGKPKCDNCQVKETKYANVPEALKNHSLNNVKMLLADRYDAAWLLEDIGRVLWGRMEFLDADAIANALRETADFIVELKNETNDSTKNVTTETETEKQVSETDQNSSETIINLSEEISNFFN